MKIAIRRRLSGPALEDDHFGQSFSADDGHHEGQRCAKRRANAKHASTIRRPGRVVYIGHARREAAGRNPRLARNMIRSITASGTLAWIAAADADAQHRPCRAIRALASTPIFQPVNQSCGPGDRPGRRDHAHPAAARRIQPHPAED